MWVRKRLDIGWSDLALGCLRTLAPSSRAAAERRIAALWGPGVLACLSVRSGLDLLLSTLAWPAGSEVLMSALTIPDMPRIVRQHGLLPVPVDLDRDSLGLSLAGLRRALTPASRALLVAHLAGGRLDLEPLLQFAQQHGLLVIEDCAQAFAGPEYLGHPQADASLFSFGTIKTATALGGALVRVRDERLCQELRRRQAEYPVQARRAYLTRLLKYAGLKGLSSPRPLGVLVGGARRFGIDYDRRINAAVRGFAGPDFFTRIRQQPSTPLLAVLERRLRTYQPRRLQRRTELGRLLQQLLQDRFPCPGAALPAHNFWVFPILVDDCRATQEWLWQAGFDATPGHSMAVVPPPADRPELAATTAQQILERVLYLPIYPEMPEAAVRKMAQALLAQPAPNPRSKAS